MTITIEYCTYWNYEPRATSLAAEIKDKYPDAEVKLIPSKGGRFEVLRDGVPVYEKSKNGRHAQPGEVLRLLAQAGARSEGTKGWAGCASCACSVPPLRVPRDAFGRSSPVLVSPRP